MRWLLVVGLIGCGARTDLPIEERRETRDEICNLEDDDGDGAIDEGEQSCGIGECRKTIPLCDECTPFDPSPEICDGLDNDCDGAIDDDIEPSLLAGPITIFAGPFSNGLELVETPEGILAVIAGQGLGAPPNRVVITRRIGRDGLPTAEPVIFDDLSATQGPTMTPSADGLFHMTICAPRGFENQLASQLIDAQGERVGPLVRREPTRSCGADESFSIWTGEAHITAWVENSSAPTFETEILLDVSNEEARSRRSQVLLDDTGNLSAQPFFTRVGDRVLMIAGRTEPPDFTQQLQSFVFDLSGALVAGPILIDTPEGFSPKHPRLVSRGDSALMVLANRSAEGVLIGRLGVDGELERPLRWMEGTRGRYNYPAITGSGGDIVYTASVSGEGLSEKGEVLGLDRDGNIRWSYVHLAEEEPGYFGWPAIVQSGGRIYVMYTTPLSEELFEERLIVLGCDPTLEG